MSRNAESGQLQSDPEFGKENILSEFAVTNSEIGTTVPSVSAWATGNQTHQTLRSSVKETLIFFWFYCFLLVFFLLEYFSSNEFGENSPTK